MTLEKISYADLPNSNRSNPNKKFAEQCVEDFAKLKCDAVKVTGWPIRRSVHALRNTMSAAVKAKAMTARVKVHADKDFVYLSLVR